MYKTKIMGRVISGENVLYINDIGPQAQFYQL